MDTVASRQLSAIYIRHPVDSLACLAGHFQGAMPILDSVTSMATSCPPQTFAMIGFVYEQPQGSEFVPQMIHVLSQRPDVMLAGVVSGLRHEQIAGRWKIAPTVLAVWRTPPPRVPERRGDGP